MPKALLGRYNGRFHSEVEVLREISGTVFVKETRPHSSEFGVGKSELVSLKDNETFVSILWAGGWDEYSVDLSTVRDQTESEKNAGTDPTPGGWLRGLFAKGLYGKDQCAKIVRHFAGGD
ncbi:hypothetical protein C4565_00455 [Candidatus Parcubacteria bacterium]|nr:MAG: hypothetical protein C4565_00455 [Candidatus Parcubacteria bacterium]